MGDVADTIDEIVDDAVARAPDPPKTFRPATVDDRFERRVRDDHAPNQVLHDVLSELDSVDNTNFLGTHAPGEQDGRPRHYVTATFVNKGMGHPTISPEVQALIDRDAVKLVGVYRCSDDELVVELRPIERTVEPVEIRYDDLPNDVFDLDDVERIIDDVAHGYNPNTAASLVFKDVVEAFEDYAGR